MTLVVDIIAMTSVVTLHDASTRKSCSEVVAFEIYKWDWSRDRNFSATKTDVRFRPIHFVVVNTSQNKESQQRGAKDADPDGHSSLVMCVMIGGCEICACGGGERGRGGRDNGR